MPAPRPKCDQHSLQLGGENETRVRLAQMTRHNEREVPVATLYRGVNEKKFREDGRGLKPKKLGGVFATEAQCGDEHAVCGSGVECGTSARNTVIGHQWMQKGMPTQGISTSPYFERARFYALDGGKCLHGYVYEIEVSACAVHGVTIYQVNNEARVPDVPADNEHLLVAADCGPLPKEVVVKVHQVYGLPEEQVQ